MTRQKRRRKNSSPLGSKTKMILMRNSADTSFSNPSAGGFSHELRSRVNSYFKDNKLNQKEGASVYFKSIFWISIYLGSFALILSGIVNVWGMLALALAMGLSMAGIGLNTMHGANHGTFSKNKFINKLAGSTLCLFGGNPFFWKLQHNVLHHTYTNVHSKDEDIDAGSLLRFSHQEKLRWFHRYQHLYFPLLYSLMTLLWAFHKDYDQLVRYHKMGLIKQHRSSFSSELVKTTVIKLGYIGYIVILPLLIGDFTWWQWGIGFLTMHFSAGLILALIFQSAHVVGETDFPMPDNDGQLTDEWMMHQLRTTSNFATSNRWLSWLLGGLNFQVEHHLFPSIGHAHFGPISKIVRKCAIDFNLPYNESPTFGKAIFSHVRLLKHMGRN